MSILRLQSNESLKLLGDNTRLAILRALMARPATISQLGECLSLHPAQIRNHLKRLEAAGLVELAEVVIVRNYTEKYYRATADAYFINLAIFSEESERGQLVILGSDDPALELLARMVNGIPRAPLLTVLPVGSLDGLIYLRENYCQVTGCHLYDMHTGEYNTPFVRLLFTGQPITLVNLSHRQQGLLVRNGNPLNISSIADLERPEVTFINRRRGSGTRMWLDQELHQFGIEPETINGYVNEAGTHAAVASAISTGEADTGIAIASVTSRFGLDFIPLFEERYDLVMTEATYHSAPMQPVLKMINTPEYQERVFALGGYNVTHTGEVIKT